MPLSGPIHIPPIGEQTDPDKVRVAAIVGGQLASAPARGFGLTANELSAIEVLTSDDSINAKDFGAVGDNVADDTAALNAFFAAIRASRITSVTPEGTVIRAVIPPGVYKCGNVNATGIKALNWVLECQGAILNGVVAGKPVLDMMGCRWFQLRDLTIIGDATNKPTFGLQHGRIVPTNSYGETTFINLRISGVFTKACYVNVGAEIVNLWHPTFFNYDTVSSSFCAILDGRFDAGVTSDFVTITLTPGTINGPFSQLLFVGADMRKIVTGGVFQVIGNPSGLRMISSYMATMDAYAIYFSKTTIARNIQLEVHVEVQACLGWMLIDNTAVGANVSFSDLSMRDFGPHGSICIINTTGNTWAVSIDGLDMRMSYTTNTIGSIVGNGAGAGVGTFLVSGMIAWDTDKPLNLTGMFFNGVVETQSSVTVPITHCVGAYRIVNRPAASGDRVNAFKGQVRAYGGGGNTTTFDNYVEMLGSTAGAQVQINAGGSDTDIDLQLVAKGTNGRVRFGALTANADQPITGYISIKTSDGTVRKLAVIT